MRVRDGRCAKDRVVFGLAKNKLLEQPVVKDLLEPEEEELDELHNGSRQPEDGMLPEEGCGGAPEGSRWGGM